MDENKRTGVWLVPMAVLIWAACLVIWNPDDAPIKSLENLKDRIFRSLDWRGGTRLQYKMNRSDALQKGINTPGSMMKALKQAQRVFLFRLRNFDLTENAVKTLGDDTIIIEVPETKGVEEAIHRTGVVTFREVIEGPFLKEDLTATQKTEYFTKVFTAKEGPFIGYYKLGPPFLGAEDINYEETRAEWRNGWNVVFKWNPSSSNKAQDELDKLYYSKEKLAICIDKEIQSVAIVASERIDTPIITGIESSIRAGHLAKVLAGGFLPVSFELTGSTQIGPRLGSELQKKALLVTGGAVAFILILIILRCVDQMAMIFICLVSLGLCAGAYVCLVLSGTTILSAATLCAYVALAGMSVDNLILVFEEFRYQTRQKSRLGGKQAANELIKAYNNEKEIILLANISTILIIGSMYFAHGPIQDLVKATCLGIVITWITTVWYPSRLYGSTNLVRVLESYNLSMSPLLDLDHKRRSIFNPRIQGLLTIVYLVAVIFSMTCFVRNGFRVGLDLQGGTEILVTSNVSMDTNLTRHSADEYFNRRCTVVQLNSTTEAEGVFRYLIQIPGAGKANVRQVSASVVGLDLQGAMTNEPKPLDQYINVLKSATGIDNIEIDSIQSIGGTELALKKWVLFACIVIAFIILFIIVKYYYGFPSAFFSVIALLMDAIIALGAVSLFQVPLTVPVIASILTVIGFSLYDSLLLCGHVHKACNSATGESPEDVLQPLSARLIVTSAAMGGATAGMWVFGTDIMKDFGIVLTTGVVFGLMSSVTIVKHGVEKSNFKRL